MATPLEIAMALHYWTKPGPYAADDPQHANSPAVRTCENRMSNAGLLQLINPRPDGTRYVSTDALKVYITALCNVPWPVQEWVIPSDA